MVGGFLGGPPCSGPAEGAPSPEIRGGVPGKALAAIRRSGVERGSDIGLVAIVAMQLGVESADALGYLFAVFLYAIAATVILPIPVELLLPLYPGIDPAIKAVVLGLGKAAGAIVVFYVGKKVNPHLERLMGRHDLAAKILKPLEGFVRRTGWIGLTVLLANLIGGIARAYIVLWLLGG